MSFQAVARGIDLIRNSTSISRTSLPAGYSAMPTPVPPFLRSPAALAARGGVAPRWQCQAREAPDEPRSLLPWYPDRRLASATHGDPCHRGIPRNPTQDAPPAADARRGRGSGARRGARVGDEARWSDLGRSEERRVGKECLT